MGGGGEGLKEITRFEGHKAYTGFILDICKMCVI